MFGNLAAAYFEGKFLLKDTPQVILDLMTPVLSLSHVGGRANGRSHRQTDFEYYIYR